MSNANQKPRTSADGIPPPLAADKYNENAPKQMETFQASSSDSDFVYCNNLIYI